MVVCMTMSILSMVCVYVYYAQNVRVAMSS